MSEVQKKLEVIVPRDYLPGQFITNQRWTDLYAAFGYIFDMMKDSANGLIDLVDIAKVPIEYAEHLANRSGLVIQQVFGFEGDVRRQLREAVYWTKIRGTALAIEGAIKSAGLSATLYSLWTGDYNSFVKFPINEDLLLVSDSVFLSDTGSFSDSDDGNYYLSSHFDIEINLIREVEENKLIIANVFDAIKSQIDNNVKPIVTVPHYYTELLGYADDQGDLYIYNSHWSNWTEDPTHPIDFIVEPNAKIYSRVIEDNWVPFFDITDLDTRLTTFKLGTGHVDGATGDPKPPVADESDLDNVVYTGSVRAIYNNKDENYYILECLVDRTVVNLDSITEFGVYDDVGKLVMIATFPSIEFGNFGKYFRMKVNYTLLDTGFGYTEMGLKPFGDAYSWGVNTVVEVNKLINDDPTTVPEILGGEFITLGVQIGMIVRNITDETQATVESVDSETKLTLDADIFTGIGKEYDILEGED